jgi:hypothetical protein
VRATYNEIRVAAREYEAMLREVRWLAFFSGVRKSHPAFWRGDVDLDKIPGFDSIAQEAVCIFPWLANEGDATRRLFEICQLNESDFVKRDDQCWAEALQRCEHELTAAQEAAEAEATRFDPAMFDDTTF